MQLLDSLLEGGEGDGLCDALLLFLGGNQALVSLPRAQHRFQLSALRWLHVRQKCKVGRLGVLYNRVALPCRVQGAGVAAQHQAHCAAHPLSHDLQRVLEHLIRILPNLRIIIIIIIRCVCSGPLKVFFEYGHTLLARRA